MNVALDVFFWISLLSVAGLLFSIVLIILVLAFLPEDYFISPQRNSLRNAYNSPIKAIGIVIKNILGLLLVAIGILLLVLPGQGVLTILLGLVLLDFPGKYKFERKIIKRPRILRQVNRLRKRLGRESLVLTEDKVKD